MKNLASKRKYILGFMGRNTNDLNVVYIQVIGYTRIAHWRHPNASLRHKHYQMHEKHTLTSYITLLPFIFISFFSKSTLKAYGRWPMANRTDVFCCFLSCHNSTSHHSRNILPDNSTKEGKKVKYGANCWQMPKWFIVARALRHTSDTWCANLPNLTITWSYNLA